MDAPPAPIRLLVLAPDPVFASGLARALDPDDPGGPEFFAWDHHAPPPAFVLETAAGDDPDAAARAVRDAERAGRPFDVVAIAPGVAVRWSDADLAGLGGANSGPQVLVCGRVASGPARRRSPDPRLDHVRWTEVAGGTALAALLVALVRQSRATRERG